MKVAYLNKSVTDFMPSREEPGESVASKKSSSEKSKAISQTNVDSSPRTLRESSGFERKALKLKRDKRKMPHVHESVQKPDAPGTTAAAVLSTVIKDDGSDIGKGDAKENVHVQQKEEKKIPEDLQFDEIVETGDFKKQEEAETEKDVKNIGPGSNVAKMTLDSPVPSAKKITGIDNLSAEDFESVIKAEQMQRSAQALYDENPRPDYPEVAKLRGWEGTVWLEVLVLKDGRVGDVTLVDSSGYSPLDRIARKTVHRWKFKPAVSMGVEVDSKVRVPIRFKLN